MTIQPSTVRTLRELIHLAVIDGIDVIAIADLQAALDIIEERQRETVAYLESLDRAGL